ncbi:hypothetical protein NDU88_004859 [Pleurodeles waltl]|uniref:Uncharacterized protein n=1 Tax=Pleurodeles waltl TaxID=8319 RepID=A0AAV7UJB0_PLEWA|nr:hypothetical protein NDU88_004859 [Pleurodeles waltl]
MITYDDLLQASGACRWYRVPYEMPGSNPQSFWGARRPYLSGLSAVRPKVRSPKSPEGMRAQTTQSFPVIRGIGSVLFPLRVSACILIYGSPSSFSRSHAPAGNVGGFFPKRHLGQLFGLKRDARIGAAYCEFVRPMAQARSFTRPLAGRRLILPSPCAGRWKAKLVAPATFWSSLGSNKWRLSVCHRLSQARSFQGW